MSVLYLLRNERDLIHLRDLLSVLQLHIVIMSGYSHGSFTSLVDIVDTAPHNNNNNNGEPTIVAEPSKNMSQCYFGAAVIDNRIFVVGGWVNGGGSSTSVESLLLFPQQPQEDKDHTNSNSNVSCIFSNSSWRVEPQT